jgi:hypothetical protein
MIEYPGWRHFFGPYSHRHCFCPHLTVSPTMPRAAKEPKQPKMKAKKNNSPAKKGTQSRKPTVGLVADLVQLGKEAQANVKQHIKAVRTVKSYVDHIWRTREWFAPIAKSIVTNSGEKGNNTVKNRGRGTWKRVQFPVIYGTWYIYS